MSIDEKMKSMYDEFSFDEASYLICTCYDRIDNMAENIFCWCEWLLRPSLTQIDVDGER